MVSIRAPSDFGASSRFAGVPRLLQKYPCARSGEERGEAVATLRPLSEAMGNQRRSEPLDVPLETHRLVVEAQRADEAWWRTWLGSGRTLSRHTAASQNSERGRRLLQGASRPSAQLPRRPVHARPRNAFVSFRPEPSQVGRRADRVGGMNKVAAAPRRSPKSLRRHPAPPMFMLIGAAQRHCGAA